MRDHDPKRSPRWCACWPAPTGATSPTRRSTSTAGCSSGNSRRLHGGSSCQGEDRVERIAQCQCGSLQVIVTGEPDLVGACHCIDCQRRTGAVFGSGAFYNKSQVRVEGSSKVYTRDGQEGRKVRSHFCPNCGTSVYWDLDRMPDRYGIAVGAFADPAFPSPSISVWERSMHTWVSVPPGAEHFQQLRPTLQPS